MSYIYDKRRCIASHIIGIKVTKPYRLQANEQCTVSIHFPKAYDIIINLSNIRYSIYYFYNRILV